MNKEVIIIGAGGHGKVVADIIQKSGDKVRGFLDDNPNLGVEFSGFPLLGNIGSYKRFVIYPFVIAIGNAKIRESISKKLCDVQWYTAIHPDAVIADIDIAIGEGTVIMANAIINAGSKIGKHCIVNSGAIVEHDNTIADFAHISVGAKLAGTVKIGKRTWIGIGATVSNNLNICADCMIGAGAVVTRNIYEAGTYVGVPVLKL